MGASQSSGFFNSFVKKRKRSAESPATSSAVDVPKATRLRSIDTSSSSSVSGQLGYEYDVFLSFRGGDTRKGFTDSLFTALKGAGIRVFRDNERLAVGEEIGPELLHGIKHSSISIPIFSENYASSKWCLEELAFMMECREARKQIVLPVFYDVTPNQVQHQTGSYASAFRQHAEKRVPETVRRWRQALAEVGSLKGWDLEKDANGFQGKLIEMIIKKVSRELKKAHLCVSNNLVGIDNKVEEVMGMLDVEAPDVRFVGIWGMGGIGKTTLAKAVYNRVVDDFDGCSFLEDVREKSHSHNGVRQLQSQLVADLLRWDRQDFATVDEGINELRRRFHEKKVLILLDDVDHVDQLSALAAEVDWFGRGSRIIITTRNKSVLIRAVVEEHQVYEVKEMGAAEALQLFCKHALRKDAPPVRLRALSEEIVEGTGGLPLALEVIGSFLHGKSEEAWKATSKKLKRVPKHEVQHKLRISYEALEREQQQMFLDVACLFIGEDKRTVTYFWEDCYEFPPEADIEQLQLLSLIKIREDDRLGMHDQLRDLGREIVRQENYKEPGKRSRLWGKDAVDVLQNNQGSRSIEAIRLEYEIGSEDCYFRAEQFIELSKLRFLQLGCANLAGNFKHLLPELRWFRWRISPLSCTATNLNIKNLLILEVSHSRFTHNWNLWSSIQMMAMKLKVLDLSYCEELKRTPDFSDFRCLERLNLQNCIRLEIIDPSIGKLKNLAFLNMEGCRSIKELPELIGCKERLFELVIDRTSIKELPSLEGLEKLQILSAKYCEFLTKIPSSVSHLTSLADLKLKESNISELPESIGSLVTLRRLNLAGTPLMELPISIGGLKSLVELVLSKTRVAILPNSIEHLTNLEVLMMDRSSLHCLPAALGRLEKLKLINASECRLLGEIPMELGSLSSLSVLLLRHTKITNIPETIRDLSCLETLDLAWCTQLQTLPELPSSLRSLSVTCQSLVSMPYLPKLINLKKLEFVRSMVPREILELTKLEKLRISRSNATVLLDETGGFPSLRELFIGNVNLQCLSGLPSGLHKLSISRCHSLRSAELSNLQNLSELSLHGCPELVEIGGLGDLMSLRILSISFCARIAKLDGLEKLESLHSPEVYSCENLRRLDDLSKLSGCRKLVEIERTHGLHALIYLEIFEVSIETLSDLSCLKSLRRLRIEKCNKLQGLDGLDELEELRDLYIAECKAIERLPSLSKLKRLENLCANHCEKLQGFDGLHELKELSSFCISGCKSIQKLPDLSSLKSLYCLYADGCEELEGFEGLDGLESMCALDISGCKAIARLPGLSNLKSLYYLNAGECENLQGLEGLDKLSTLNQLIIRGCKSIEKLPDLSDLTVLRYFDADGCEKLQQVQGIEETKKPVRSSPRGDWRQCLEANCIEKLQELDGLLEFWLVDLLEYPHNERRFMKLLNQSNWGVLVRWYADGCEKIPELEGLENLEKYHLSVIPDENAFRFRKVGLYF